MRQVWRSRTGFYGLAESAGRYYPMVAGRTYPVALDGYEAAELRDALCQELRALPPAKRPGPTETKGEDVRQAPDTLPPNRRTRSKGT